PPIHPCCHYRRSALPLSRRRARSPISLFGCMLPAFPPRSGMASRSSAQPLEPRARLRLESRLQAVPFDSWIHLSCSARRNRSNLKGYNQPIITKKNRPPQSPSLLYPLTTSSFDPH